MAFLFCSVLFFIIVGHSLAAGNPSRQFSSPSVRRASAPNAAGVTASGLHAPSIDCNGGSLPRIGLFEALRKLPHNPAPVIFERTEPQREPGPSVVLPHRVMNDDGSVYIEIGIKDNAEGTDWASWQEIGDVVRTALGRCGSQASMIRGSMASGVGVLGLLTITISAYDNGGILCADPAQTQFLAPRYESCRSLIDGMEKSDKVLTWGDTPAPGGILLPKTIASPDRACTASLRMSSPGNDSASWADFWAPIVAATEKCVRHGNFANAIDIGREEKMQLILFGAPRHNGSPDPGLGTSNSTSGVVNSDVTTS